MEVHIPKVKEADVCRRCKEYTPVIYSVCFKACNHYTAFVLNDARFQILRKLRG